MANYTIYALAESEMTISNGAVLDGVTQGDGSHLLNETITLNSNNWEAVAISDGGTDVNFSDTDSDQTLNGTQTIFGTSYSGGTRVEAEYTLTVEDPDGNVYTLIGFNINNSSPAYGTVEGLAFIGSFPPRDVALTVTGTAEGPPNSGGTSTPATTYATPPCFVSGTLIDTDKGPVPVERLRPGQRIRTLDEGYQPLLLSLATTLSADALARAPGNRPIRICKDAIRPGTPARDITVSPQHKVLVDDWRAELFFGTDEVLVPAKYLVNGIDIRIDERPRGVTYHHLVFGKHQILSAHGLFSESFLPGRTSIDGLDKRAKSAFFEEFPHLGEGFEPYGATARPTIRQFEATMLAA